MICSTSDILKMSEEQIAALPNRYRISFDDGVMLDVTRNKVIYSNYFWNLIRKYNKVPLVSAFYVGTVLKDKMLDSKTHSKLIDLIYEAITIEYDMHFSNMKDELLYDLYALTSTLQQELPKHASSHVTTIDILDFIELVDHAVISKSLEETVDTYKSIDKCYSTVKDVLYNYDDVANNSVVLAVRSNMVNVNQVLQAVAIRGKVTEVDGTILSNGVMSNLTNGFTELYDFIAESRSAAKSLYYSDAKLQDTEYAARRLQHLGMSVEKLENTDCGSTQYLDWNLQGPKKDENGATITNGDLEFMVGKYYLDENTNTLKDLTIHDTHLYGKTIKLRSVLYCRTPNSHNVCKVCFGRLGENLSPYANLGHVCTATMTQQSTQSVLSTKHLDFSSLGANVVLNEVTSRYFLTTKDKSSYLLKPYLKDKNVKIVVSKDEVSGLADIHNVDNPETISPLRLSAIEYADIVIDDNGMIVTDMLNLAQGNKRVILTKDFIMHLREHKWKQDSNNNLVFSLEHWDFSLPIFSLPAVEYSYSDHSEMIASLIESSAKNVRKRALDKVAIATLQELFVLTNSKIRVNLAMLEVIIYAVSINDVNDYRLDREHNSGKLGVASLIVKNRSLGIAYTNEGIHDTIMSPDSFSKENRPDSVFDVFIDPAEYLKYNPA